ncbi:MAG TPA: radical SAM protein [Candidatus Deferrimicrobiaceae bacterium]
MTSPDVLLIHPPAARPAEPPLCTGVLLSRLRRMGVRADAIDANLEAYLHLLGGDRLSAAAGPGAGTTVRRAVRHAPRALSFLRSPGAAASFPRYAAAARHLAAALSAYRGESGSERLTLGDYRHGGLSEFSPTDLSRVADGREGTVFSGYFREDLLPRVAGLRPRCVGISVNFRHQVLPAFELAGLLRRALPGVPVVGGGGLLTSWKRPLLAAGRPLPAFTRVVFGPGEGALAWIAAGDVSREEYFLRGSGEAEFLPDFGFAELRGYISPEPVLPVAASRGCYWGRCAFCPEGVAPTHPYRTHDPAAFPELLRELSRRYGVKRFHLTDNAIPPPTLRALVARADALRGVSWHGFVRFERDLLAPGFSSGLAAAGCAMLQLGLESGSQPLLDRMGKGTRVSDASAILANLKAAGIATYVYVMLGAPGETAGDAEATLAFLEGHAGEIDCLNLSILNLPREAEGETLPGDEGTSRDCAGRDDEPLGLYRPVPPAAGWGRPQARRFLSRRILGSPALREIVARTPPGFASSHAFFFRGGGAPAAAGNS